METIAKTRKGIAESWDSIKERYPDSFVLLVNPEYNPRPYLKKAVFVYKNRNKKKVYEKAQELGVGYSIVQYTGGKRLDELDENLLLL
ncbi:MAG: hypothetical protein FWC39_12240 [Bacteroidetes bacterium]|nr:hypothetical protein [Bacteroidota bacterium]